MRKLMKKLMRNIVHRFPQTTTMTVSQVFVTLLKTARRWIKRAWNNNKPLLRMSVPPLLQHALHPQNLPCQPFSTANAIEAHPDEHNTDIPEPSTSPEQDHVSHKEQRDAGDEQQLNSYELRYYSPPDRWVLNNNVHMDKDACLIKNNFLKTIEKGGLAYVHRTAIKSGKEKDQAGGRKVASEMFSTCRVSFSATMTLTLICNA